MKSAHMQIVHAATASLTSVGQHDNRQDIADRMEALAIELRTLSDNEVAAIPSEATLASLAGKIYDARRKVDNVFGISGFSASPAWDIMLDLFKAKAEEKQISVSSACIGAACPATTGLRWLQVLENMQLIERAPDPEDRRRTVVGLTQGAIIKVTQALAAHL